MQDAPTLLWLQPVVALLFGYLLGSVPFGVVLTRLAGAGDLRAIGSGNIGATNVLRTGRKGLAAATLFLDGFKGWVAVVAIAAWSPPDAPLAAIGAFVGHLYPVWLGFRGGKGVATLMGVVLALSPVCGLVYALAWLGILALARISSLAGLTAAFSAPIAAALFGRFDLVLLFLAFAILVLWKHRANVDRLIAGTEPRVGGSKGG
jgi:acyl phosphate:glycerol-3-phosphate acyltransferase